MKVTRDSTMTSSEDERARLSREIHDGLGQHLQGMRYLVTALESRMVDDNNSEVDEIRRLGRHLDEALESVRIIARDLSPVEEMFGGLQGALESHARLLTSIYGVDVRVRAEPGALDPTRALNLFRLAQEATANAIRHSYAHRIEIMLTLGDRRELVVQDDGRGFDVNRRYEGFGLRHMQTRATLIGGRFEIISNSDNGSRVSCVDWMTS